MPRSPAATWSPSLPGSADYTFAVRNLQLATGGPLVSTQAVLSVTPVTVNGVPTYPSFQSVSGGVITDFDPDNGKVTLDLGDMLPGETRNLGLTLGFPAGSLNLATYQVGMTVTGSTACGDTSSASDSVTGTLSATPALQVFKEDALSLITSGGFIDYTLNFRNLGTAPSTNTWVVDRVPFKTVFVEATAPGGEEVWFTDALPPTMPANQISVINPVDFGTIQANFAPGIQDDNGTPGDPSDDTWTSPFGDQTTWDRLEGR